MKRLTIVAAIAASIALAAPMTSQARTDQYTYRAGDSLSTDFEKIIRDKETPIGRVAALGYFFVTPSGTSFTLNVDDFGTLNGLEVAVSVHTSDGFLFKGCLPVRSTRTITGTVAGRTAVVWIENLGPRSFPGTCSGMATAGVATVTGAK